MTALAPAAILDDHQRTIPAGGTLALDIHGVRVRVSCVDPSLLARVADDFLHFHTVDDECRLPALHLALVPGEPRYSTLPALRATAYTPRNICYTAGDRTYIDYFGRALAIYDRGSGAVEVQSDRPHLLHEIAYLTILSRVSEQLERRGLHRVHACAVAIGGRSALFLLPSGGGKTTLALAFLKAGGGVRLVSEDSPLVDRRGVLHPFPLRIGILSETAPPFPPEFVTYTERMEFAPKYLVSLRAFPGAVETVATRPELLFIATRSLGTACRIEPAGRLRGFRALLRDMIVGIGLYQGLEFMLRTSALDLLRYVPVVAGRIRAAVAMLRRVEVFEVELGRDPETNVATVLTFLRERKLGRGA
jgi:hypothetical protein